MNDLIFWMLEHLIVLGIFNCSYTRQTTFYF
jgi:hypothetical protein